LSVECRKVALLGAAGGIGQPLALLLKMNRQVSELALYDIANVVGVAADLSHCNTPVKVGAMHSDLSCIASLCIRYGCAHAFCGLLLRPVTWC
jgi:malate/lactate dehydrogenase